MNDNTTEHRVLNRTWLLQYINQFPWENITELDVHMWFALYGKNIKIEEETNEQDTDTKEVK